MVCAYGIIVKYEDKEGFFMKNKNLALSLVALACAGACALADTPFPAAKAAAAANLKRIEAFRKDAYWKDAPFAVASVDPVGGIRRNPALFPEDGDFTNAVKVIAAGNEYENASILLFAYSDLKDVVVTPGALVGPGGARLDAKEIDTKVVKVWYQQGTAWGSFFSDPLRRIPTPELLLHDEALVDVDHDGQENFVRCDYKSGTAYRWVSFNGAIVDHSYDGGIKNEWIHDAPALKPFGLLKNEFKQLMFTLHVPAGQRPGIYKGAFAVSVAGKKVCDVPVKLKVLPFDLPLPAAFRDLERPFMVSPYMGNISVYKSENLVRNMVRHNVRNCLLPKIASVDEARAAYEMFKKTGFDTKYLFCALPGCGVTTSYPAKETDANFSKYMNSITAASNSIAAIREVFGPETKAYSYGIDEGSAWTVRSERATWQGIHRAGGNTVVATQYHPYILFNLDYANTPRHPRGYKRAAADDFHAGNADGLIGWYADPHSGPENPDYTRRLYGWQTWRNNYDASCQYILFRDNWNDFWVPAEAFLRGLMLVYPQDNDILDTIEWEGLREGMDDVRYGTLLKQLGEKANHSKDIDTVYAARAALTWLAQVDCEHSALKYLRLEMASRIIDLQTRLAKEGK